MSLGPARIIVTPNAAVTELSSNEVSEDVFESYYEYDEERLSVGGKRQRGDNWTYEDKELLVECVARHPVVEDRSNEKEINVKKHHSWKLISEAMALRGSRKNNGSSTRNPQKVREQWVRLKGKAKSVLRRGRSNSVVSADDSGAYKKGPTPIDYRIKEIFPHLFGTKAEEFDKHSCDSGQFHNGGVSLNGDLSMPASQTIDNLQLGQQNHYAIQTMDNCSQEALTPNLTQSSSEDNSYNFPSGISNAGQTNAAYNKVDGIRNGDENGRHSMIKREKNMIAATKGKRLGVKRKIPVKMNAFEHLLLQANLKKINLSIKQSEELHQLKMTVQKKESYLLDLKIKMAVLEVESKLQKTEESSVNLSNQVQMRSQNPTAPSQINLSHNHILSGQNHSQLNSSHNMVSLSTSDHRQINNAQNQLTSSQINSNQNQLTSSQTQLNLSQNQSLSSQMNSNRIQSVSGQIQSISDPLNIGHNRIISGQSQPSSSQSHNGQVGLNHGQMNSNQSQMNPHQCQINTNSSQMNSSQSQMSSNQSQMNPHQSQINTNSSQMNSSQSQLNPHQSQMNTNSSQINLSQSQLNPHQSQMNTNSSQMNSSQSQMTSTQSQMNPTQSQMNPHRNQMNSNPSQLISNQIQRTGSGGGMSIMELNENLENNGMNGTHPRIMIQRGALHNHHQHRSNS